MKRYAFLDLETTGFDPLRDSIIEVSFVIMEGEKEIARYDQVMRPDKSGLTPFVEQLTGITQEEILREGRHMDDERQAIVQMLSGCTIVGHNIDFDIGFLQANGVEVAGYPRLDTHELARIILPREESYSLEILSRAHNLPHPGAHRAMADVVASRALLKLLEEKATHIPEVFLQEIRPLLTAYPESPLVQFFLNLSGSTEGKDRTRYAPPQKTEKISPLPEKITTALAEITPQRSLFIRIFETAPSCDLLRSTADAWVQKGEKVLIITPRFAHMKGEDIFPTPEVLIDPDRLNTFITQEESSLPEPHVAFAIQCLYRAWLGFRGKDHFDLYADQRRLWNHVCVQDADAPLYRDILKEKSSCDTLVLSPRAFVRFSDLEIFRDRVLLIDEAEMFAQEMLFGAEKRVSLRPLMESDDESLSKDTQFFTARFCKEVLEPTLGHPLDSGFPEKTLLPEAQTWEDFQSGFLAREECTDVRAVLSATQPGIIRWAEYNPERESLVLSAWNRDTWEAKKASLDRWRKIFFHRHKNEHSNDFFHAFVGMEQGFSVDAFPAPSEEKVFRIPQKIPAQHSPDFARYMTHSILHATKTPDARAVVGLFSSLDSLRTVYEDLQNTMEDNTPWKVIGEKVAGGDGKMMQFFAESERTILLAQKIDHPAFMDTPWNSLIVQKIPFPPPHPLLSEFERLADVQGKNWWHLWVVPQVAALLSRRVAPFAHAREWWLLDPRMNAPWAKGMIATAFPEYVRVESVPQSFVEGTR